MTFCIIYEQDHITTVCLEEQTVNAIQLYYIVDLSRKSIPKTLQAFSITASRIYRGYYAIQGTYIAFGDTLNLCSMLKLFQSISDILSRLIKTMNEDSDDTQASYREDIELLQTVGDDKADIIRFSFCQEATEIVHQYLAVPETSFHEAVTDLKMFLWEKNSNISHLSCIGSSNMLAKYVVSSDI